MPLILSLPIPAVGSAMGINRVADNEIMDLVATNAC